MKLLLPVLALLATLAVTPPASAQSFPSRPISIVVPFAPGGPTDVIARSLAQHMTATLGQSVIVENQAGANGTTMEIAREGKLCADADGVTASVASKARTGSNSFIFVPRKS